MSDELRSDYDRFAMLPEAVLFSEISAKAVRLFAVLQRHVGANASAWPSRAKLGEEMRCSLDTVDRAIKELQAAGLLHVERRGGAKGDRWTSSLYTLTRPSRSSAASPSRNAAASPSRTDAASLAAEPVDEREPSTESHPKESQEGARPRKRCRIPESFTVDDELRAWAAEQAPGVDLDHETACFIDWHAGRGTPMLDWRRAWQTWMRKARQSSRPRQTQNRTDTGLTDADRDSMFAGWR